MGAGAGYTIDVNGTLKNLDESTITPVRLDKFSLVIKCDGEVVGDINAASYYYGTGTISNVRMQLSEVAIYLPIGEGINSEVLTSDAVAKYTEQFGVDDVEDLYTELDDVLEISDIDMGFVLDAIRNSYYEGTSDTLSAGWIHSTFDGDFQLTEVDDHSGYNYLKYANLTIIDNLVVEYIDSAVTGDNVQYVALENYDVIDAFATEEEAISALKEYIRDEVLTKYPIDEVDFSAYTVQEEFYYMTDAENYGDSDWGEVVWTADESDFV